MADRGLSSSDIANALPLIVAAVAAAASCGTFNSSSVTVTIGRDNAAQTLITSKGETKTVTIRYRARDTSRAISGKPFPRRKIRGNCLTGGKKKKNVENRPATIAM